MENNNISDISDETLVREARIGPDMSGDAIVEIFLRFEPAIKSIASHYFVAGADSDDVIQEGRIGLFKAMMNYDPEKNDKFRPFALMCIKRQIQTAVSSASRKKHLPLNSYVSLDKNAYENDDDSILLEAAEAEIKNPEAIFIDRENREGIGNIINSSLSPTERTILDLYMKNLSYKEIAAKTGKTAKSVDNAIQSIKKKLKAKISE